MAVQLIVTGKVQGVFFRAFVRETAQKLGIRGFAKNLSDGSVEIHAEGSETKLQDFIKECRKGISGSRIDALKVVKATNMGFKGFDIKY